MGSKVDKNRMEVKLLSDCEIDSALKLIWEVFQEFVAPFYTTEGITNFYHMFIQSEEFRNKFRIGQQRGYGMFVNDELAGVVSVSASYHMSCLFVKGKYHKQGIGTKLLEAVVEECRRNGVPKIELNASPYAVPFYHYMGFRDVGEQTSYKGIVYTPMELNLEDSL